MLDDELQEEIAKTLPRDVQTLFISAVAQKGIQALKDALWDKISNDPFAEG